MSRQLQSFENYDLSVCPCLCRKWTNVHEFPPDSNAHYLLHPTPTQVSEVAISCGSAKAQKRFFRGNADLHAIDHHHPFPTMSLRSFKLALKYPSLFLLASFTPIIDSRVFDLLIMQCFQHSFIFSHVHYLFHYNSFIHFGG